LFFCITTCNATHLGVFYKARSSRMGGTTQPASQSSQVISMKFGWTVGFLCLGIFVFLQFNAMRRDGIFSNGEQQQQREIDCILQIADGWMGCVLVWSYYLPA